jgi:hypothetical protein
LYDNAQEPCRSPVSKVDFSRLAQEFGDDLSHRSDFPLGNVLPQASTSGSASDFSIELDLRTRGWRSSGQQVAWKVEPRAVTIDVLHAMPFIAKGRKSSDAKDAEHQAEAILRRSDWTITAVTPIEDIEALITVLAKCLEHWARDGVKSWCVGGSLLATLDGRDAEGRADCIRFQGCDCRCWTGDMGRAKVGNTCKFHCRITARNVHFGGQQLGTVALKKCTWMKCCYGRRPFGCDEVPWCNSCEQQKSTERKAIAPPPPAASEGAVRIPTAIVSTPKVKAEGDGRCGNCIGALAKRAQRGLSPVWSAHDEIMCQPCRNVLGKIEHFCDTLPLAEPLVADLSTGPPAKRQRAGGKQLRKKLRDLMLETVGGLELKVLALSSADPIIIEALVSRHAAGGTEIGEIWETQAAFRDVLLQLLLKDISLSSYAFEGMHRAAAAALAPAELAALRHVDMPQFVASWTGATTLQFQPA